MDELPEEIIFLILKNLKYSTLLKCNNICKLIHDIITKHGKYIFDDYDKRKRAIDLIEKLYKQRYFLSEQALYELIYRSYYYNEKIDFNHATCCNEISYKPKKCSQHENCYVCNMHLTANMCEKCYTACFTPLEI